jgi:hypothetical protein
MVVKFISKTHLQNTFFGFLSRLVSVWLQSLQEVLLWLNENIFFKMGIEDAEFDAEFESVEKISKGIMQKKLSAEKWP